MIRISKKIIITVALAGITLVPAFAAFVFPSPAIAADTIDIWWPADQSKLAGVQPFKALVSGRDVSSYKMTWKVDSGGEVDMPTNTTDYPHKETSVDFANWNWKGAGPYAITFTARDAKGGIVAIRSINIYTAVAAKPAQTSVQGQTASQSQPAAVPAQSTLVASMSTANPFSGKTLYIDKNSSAKQQPILGANTFI